MACRLAILIVTVLAVAACGNGPVATPQPVTATSTDGLMPAATTSSIPGAAALVARVVDGDTLIAHVAGGTETVRVIGLDTPESVKPGTPIECFALRATSEAKRLLPVGSAIGLEPDPTQAKRDVYGRLLAHVWLTDDTLFAERMIRGGFGIHYVYGGLPSVHARVLAVAEEAARAALRGLWSPTTCAGNDHTPAP